MMHLTLVFFVGGMLMFVAGATPIIDVMMLVIVSQLSHPCFAFEEVDMLMSVRFGHRQILNATPAISNSSVRHSQVISAPR